MSVWVITGGSGFIGQHVLDALAGRDLQLIALGRTPIERNDVRHVVCDLSQSDELAEILRSIQPDVVLHLAGKTPPATREELDAANVQVTQNLVDALANIERPVRLIATGSAAELGPVPTEDLPVGEDYLPCPETDYGRSKFAATQIVLNAPPPITPVVARVFNPTGPGMPAGQAFGRFARLLAEGDGPLELEVGDLTPRRDFVDARDVARALILLAESSATGLFHVGTSVSRSINDGLDILSSLSGRTVTIQQNVQRSSGPADSRADVRKLTTATGWRPEISLEQSLADLWKSLRAGRG